MSFVQYIKDSMEELKHISWPTKKQAILFTILVIIISFATGIYLNVFDAVFSSAVEWIIENFR